MRYKILAAVVAGGVLVGAGLITSIVSSPAVASAQDETEAPDEERPAAQGLLGILGEVLDDLVADGTLTQDQADAVAQAAEEKASLLREELSERRGFLFDIIEDGVITREEVADLPEDHWIFSDVFDGAWEDGELTRDELREAAPFSRWRGFNQRFHLRGLLDDGGIDQEEYEGLRDTHPLKQVDVSEYLEDGLITPEEVGEIFSDLKGSSGDDA